LGGEGTLEKWEPYLSERQWGTVQEEYSPNGDAWNFFTHDHALSHAYRWGEEGTSLAFSMTNSTSVSSDSYFSQFSDSYNS